MGVMKCDHGDVRGMDRIWYVTWKWWDNVCSMICVIRITSYHFNTSYHITSLPHAYQIPWLALISHHFRNAGDAGVDDEKEERWWGGEGGGAGGEEEKGDLEKEEKRKRSRKRQYQKVEVDKEPHWSLQMDSVRR